MIENNSCPENKIALESIVLAGKLKCICAYVSECIFESFAISTLIGTVMSLHLTGENQDETVSRTCIILNEKFALKMCVEAFSKSYRSIRVDRADRRALDAGPSRLK